MHHFSPLITIIVRYFICVKPKHRDKIHDFRIYYKMGNLSSNRQPQNQSSWRTLVNEQKRMLAHTANRPLFLPRAKPQQFVYSPIPWEITPPLAKVEPGTSFTQRILTEDGLTFWVYLEVDSVGTNTVRVHGSHSSNGGDFRVTLEPHKVHTLLLPRRIEVNTHPVLVKILLPRVVFVKGEAFFCTHTTPNGTAEA